MYHNLHHDPEIYHDLRTLMSPDCLFDQPLDFHMSLFASPTGHIYGSFPVFGPASEVIDEDHHHNDDFVMKNQIICHPFYPKLIDAYIGCQKVGASPETARLLDEVRWENDLYQQGSVPAFVGAGPDLDDFMESFSDILWKFKSELSRPFNEATAFFGKLELELDNILNDEGRSLSSEDEFKEDIEAEEARIASAEDQELKDALMHKYGDRISKLKLDFSKKKKRCNLSREAREMLLQWWNLHDRWPYPTDADKVLLGESTGLNPKQINNWFINQRKRHWKPSDDMQLVLMGNISEDLITQDY